MEVNKEKTQFFLQFFFDKSENASQVAEIANDVYGANTVTANYVQLIPFRKVLLKVGLERRNHLLFASVWPNTKLTCQQLNRLKLAIDQKWPELANRRGVVFLQNKARLHTSVVTRQKLWELSWEVLMYPPYSPDLATSDYLIFLAFQNFLSGKKLGSTEDCENRLLDVFANKGQDFYERHYEATFKMATNYTTKRCIFDPNRTIGSMLNQVLVFMQK
ncbi:histone-lysine N-methyltransferase SETMAR [Trichonephila clavipes]|uniref:Histone-lysine N-methyltransferase SETMAR n=1 Tax=Trichonephila clavipes TaxID=2585209 RepID=A0A8X6SQK5_TRICX|nr:histone-lysine N-methyltransferase SETMAR [Trichonephila clavipes]